MNEDENENQESKNMEVIFKKQQNIETMHTHQVLILQLAIREVHCL